MKRREILLGAAAGAVLSALPMTVTAASATIPKRLKPGATIGLIAPASVTYERLQLQLAVETIEAMGLKAKIGSHVMDRFGYLAGKDQDRADDLNEAFADPDIDAVFALRGGWGASRILPMLDYDMISKIRKFSSVTPTSPAYSMLFLRNQASLPSTGPTSCQSGMNSLTPRCADYSLMPSRNGMKTL